MRRPAPRLGGVTDRLPLFPLGTVLYPGLLLPLHIFEDRYRALVRDLVERPEGSRRTLGVVAIREGREVGADGVRALYDVGCTAELRQVEAYSDGRFDIVATGVARFRVRALDESRPYVQADVELLPEEPGPESAVLSRSVAQLFRRYRDSLLAARGQEAPEPPEVPADAALLSYLVAAAMVLDLPAKQALLAAETVTDRLLLALELLRRETAVLRWLPSLPAVDLVRSAYGAN